MAPKSAKIKITIKMVPSIVSLLSTDMSQAPSHDSSLHWPQELLHAVLGGYNVLHLFKSAQGWTFDPGRPCD